MQPVQTHTHTVRPIVRVRHGEIPLRTAPARLRQEVRHPSHLPRRRKLGQLKPPHLSLGRLRILVSLQATSMLQFKLPEDHQDHLCVVPEAHLGLSEQRLVARQVPNLADTHAEEHLELHHENPLEE